jgi:hypothetical protein
MSNTRTLVISVLGTVLLAAPLIGSPDVKTSKVQGTAIQLLPIQALRFPPRGALDGLLPVVLFSVPAAGSAPDLSRYRGFQFGETLPAVAKQAGLDVSEAKLIHARPAVIQELEWAIWLSSGSTPQTDPVRTILFSFYNGELFRILVSYDRAETQGLTTKDMTEAISAKYGAATKPANIEIAFSSTQVYNDSEAILARWEDSQYSFNLYRSTYQPTFGMIAFSKRLDAQARTASAEAIRLDAAEAPQREIQRQNQEDEKNCESLEKAREVNKSKFRL